jgi:2'-5' RNA ligase
MSDVQTLRDHWYWRPGWSPGRSFYTWHITFEGQPAMADLAQHYAGVVQLGVYDPVPLRWLHLTMQGVGFTDEISTAQIDQVVAAANRRCAALSSFRVTIGPALFDPEALSLPVQPVEPLADLRTTVRAAIADVFGDAPEPEVGYRPHVSLGYTNTTGPAESVVDALADLPPRTAEVTVDAVSLIDLNRDQKMYEWSPVASVPLG